MDIDFKENIKDVCFRPELILRRFDNYVKLDNWNGPIMNTPFHEDVQDLLFFHTANKQGSWFC